MLVETGSMETALVETMFVENALVETRGIEMTLQVYKDTYPIVL